MSNVTRPSSSNNYDERFVVPLEASRRGAHRARVSPLMAALPIVAVAGIVLGAIFLVYTLFGGLGGSDAGNDATTTASPTASATGDAQASPSPSGAGDASASPSDSASPGGSVASGEVDKSIVIDVYNGTKPLVSGVARRATPKITGGGWQTGKIQTWNGSPVTATTIYYSTPEQKATAQALAKALGKGTVKMSASKAGGQGGIAVVIGNDFTGGRSTTTSTRNPGGSSTKGPTATRTSSGATTKADNTGTPADTATPGAGGGDGGQSPSPTN